MFHEGDLQSGIARAVSETKAVLCFVRDPTELSDEWEFQFMKDDENAQAIQAHTVALKINHDSQEARYLSALCPVSPTPLIIVIKNGTIQGRLENLRDRKEFTLALRRALGLSADHDTALHSQSGPAHSQTQRSWVIYESRSDLHGKLAMPDRRTQMDCVALKGLRLTNSHKQTIDGDMNVEDTESIRGQQINTSVGEPPAQNQASRSETAIPAERHVEEINPTAASLPTRSSEVSSPEIPPTSGIESQRTEYIAQQRQREAAQRAERQRIREAIEADRKERRRKTEPAKAQPQSSTSTITSQSGQTDPSQPPSSSDVRLAVRLYTGASIRSTFPPTSTLSSTVRPWIRSHFETNSSSPSDGNIPYTFKLVLAPLPNRSISISEEEMTLEELLGDEIGMGRGSGKGGVTFIIVPEKTYTDAYVTTAGGILGVPFRAAQNGGYGILGGLVSGLRYLTGYSSSSSNATGTQGERDGSSPTPEQAGSGGTSAEGIRIRTLADQRADSRRNGDDAQLYNGNTLNFEPRRKSDDDENS